MNNTKISFNHEINPKRSYVGGALPSTSAKINTVNNIQYGGPLEKYTMISGAVGLAQPAVRQGQFIISNTPQIRQATIIDHRFVQPPRYETRVVPSKSMIMRQPYNIKQSRRVEKVIQPSFIINQKQVGKTQIGVQEIATEVIRPHYEKVHYSDDRRNVAGDVDVQAKSASKCCGPWWWILLGILGLVGLILGLLFGLGAFGGSSAVPQIVNPTSLSSEKAFSDSQYSIVTKSTTVDTSKKTVDAFANLDYTIVTSTKTLQINKNPNQNKNPNENKNPKENVNPNNPVNPIPVTPPNIEAIQKPKVNTDSNKNPINPEPQSPFPNTQFQQPTTKEPPTIPKPELQAIKADPNKNILPSTTPTPAAVEPLSTLPQIIDPKQILPITAPATETTTPKDNSSQGINKSNTNGENIPKTSPQLPSSNEEKQAQ